MDEKGLAERLFPWREALDEPKIMVIDPTVSFGRPVVAGTRVPSEALFQRSQAGDSFEELAEDFDIEVGLVEEVVRWEREARRRPEAA